MHTSVISGALLGQHKQLAASLRQYCEQQGQLGDLLARGGPTAGAARAGADAGQEDLAALEAHVLRAARLVELGRYLAATSYVHVLRPVLGQERFKGQHVRQRLDEVVALLVGRAVDEAVLEIDDQLGDEELVVNRRLFGTVFLEDSCRQALDDHVTFLLNQATMGYERRGLPSTRQVVD